MKGCELCGGAARMYCESDQASLCWDCDEKVHSANFLVAKHSRTLLCQVCRSPTPWKASGTTLGPTVSICQSCFSGNNKIQERNVECQEEHCRVGNAETEYEDDDFDDDDDDSEKFEEEEEEEEEDDWDNQVVPWSSTAASSVAPVASSSSSEGEIGCGVLGSSSGMKRIRNNCDDLDSHDATGCSYSRLDSGRLMKQPRASDVEDHGRQAEESRSRGINIIDSLKRLQQDMVTSAESASATILGVCRLSKDQSP